MLERSLTQVLRDFELERESKEDKIRKLIGDKEHEIHTLQQHNVLKNREVATIKKHAQALLGQRGEVEHFFLEALEQVKNEIREKREYEYRQAKYAHNRQIRQLAMPRPMQMTMGMKSSTQGSAPDLFKLPTIPMDNNHSNASTINNNNNNNTTHSTTHSNHSTVKLDDTQPVAAPKAPSNRVDLKDLTPEDRERVLRLLFAKINNAPPKRPVPAHSFDIDIQVDSNNSKNQHNRQAYAYDDENDENSGGHQNHSQQQQQQQYTKPLHLPPPPSDSDFNYGDSDMNSETHNDGYGSGDQKNDGTSDPSFFLTDHDENSGGTFLSGVM